MLNFDEAFINVQDLSLEAFTVPDSWVLIHPGFNKVLFETFNSVEDLSDSIIQKLKGLERRGKNTEVLHKFTVFYIDEQLIPRRTLLSVDYID